MTGAFSVVFGRVCNATEAALPPQTCKEQQAVAASPELAPRPQVQPVKEVTLAPVEQQLDKIDTRKAKERERRKRVGKPSN